MNVGDYFKMQTGKIPQIMYDSGNMKTTSYVIKTNSQTGRELDFISEPTKDNAMGKLSSTFSLFTEVAQPQTVPFPFVTNNSNYTLQNNYMFTNVLENIASNETPLYIYICNYLSNAAMIKSDNSCIIYPSQSIGIKNDGTFVYPLQCNINIPTVTTTTLYGNTYITSINYNDTTFTLTYKLYDPTNKYTKKNVDITITPLTVPTYQTDPLSGDQMLTGYNRTYTFNVSCDPKFTFEIYLSNLTTPPLSLQLNLITAPSPVPSNAPIIIDNNFFNPIYQCPYVLTYQNISSSVYTYQQSTYTFVVQNSINYSFKLYGFDFSFNPPRLQQVTNFSTISNGNPYYINYTQNGNQLVYNFGYSGPSENFTQLYMLQIIDNDTDLQLNTLFPIVLNITNSSIPALRDSLNTLNVDLSISVGVDILLISTYVALKYYILTLMTTALVTGDAASLVILDSLLAFFSF